MDKNFYNRILNGQETAEDVQRFNSLCNCYSDMYKDVYGVRPRDERTMCINGYSGNPDINAFRELLKGGFNPLGELEVAYDRLIQDEADEMPNLEEMWFFEGNPNKEEILQNYPEYEKYFA